MSDDLNELFGKHDDDEDEDFLSQLIEPEEEDFFSSLRDSNQDDLFTPVQDAEIDESLTYEGDLLDEKFAMPDDSAGSTLDEDGRPEWYGEVMEGAQFDLDAEQGPGSIKEKTPSALATFFKTGGAIGKLASNNEVMGLTPQQRMILSIFLFVDIAILGCILLVLTGAIRF